MPVVFDGVEAAVDLDFGGIEVGRWEDEGGGRTSVCMPDLVDSGHSDTRRLSNEYLLGYRRRKARKWGRGTLRVPKHIPHCNELLTARTVVSESSARISDTQQRPATGIRLLLNVDLKGAKSSDRPRGGKQQNGACVMHWEKDRRE